MSLDRDGPVDGEMPKPSVLVMRGGGARGLALLGACQILDECGLAFDTFVGTSAGAITAALLAAGVPLPDLQREMEATDFRRFLDGWFPKLSLLWRGWLFKGDHFVEWMAEVLYRATRDKRTAMSDLRRRAIIFAAGPELGLTTFDSHGENATISVARAVRYSMSIPIFFRPEVFDGRRIYDGGMLANFPLRHAIDLCGTDNFVGLYLDAGGPSPTRQRWLPLELIDVWMNQNEAHDVDKYRAMGRIVPIETTPIGTFHFDLSLPEKRYLLLCGQVAALKYLRDFGDRWTLLLTGEQIRDRLVSKVEELSHLRVGVIKERAAKQRAAAAQTAAVIVLSIAVLLVGLDLLAEHSTGYRAAVRNLLPKWALSTLYANRADKASLPLQANARIAEPTASAASATAACLAGDRLEQTVIKELRSNDDQVLKPLPGKRLLLHFWASWCGLPDNNGIAGACLAEMPSVFRVAQEFGEKGVVLVLVTQDTRDTMDTIQKFRAALPERDQGTFDTYPLYSDPDGRLQTKLACDNAVPTTVLVGAGGVIRGRWSRRTDWNTIEVRSDLAKALQLP